MRPNLVAVLVVLLCAPALAHPTAQADTTSWSALRTVTAPVTSLAHDGVYLVSRPLHWNRTDWLRAGAVMGAVGLAYAFDEQLVDAVSEQDDGPIRWLSDLGADVEPMAQIEKMQNWCLGSVAAGYVLGWQPATDVGWDLLTSYYLSSAVKTGFMELTGRSRPRTGRGKDAFRLGEGRSFPSGHTSNAFQTATILSHHIDRWWATVPLYSLATAVAVERIHSRKHWASDVIFGAAFGTAMARGILHLHHERGLGIRAVGRGLAVVISL